MDLSIYGILDTSIDRSIISYTYMSIYQPVYPYLPLFISIYRFLSLSISTFSILKTLCISGYLYLSIYLSICLSTIYLSIYLSSHTNLYINRYLSIHIYIYIFTHVHLHTYIHTYMHKTVGPDDRHGQEAMHHPPRPPQSLLRGWTSAFWGNEWPRDSKAT